MAIDGIPYNADRFAELRRLGMDEFMKKYIWPQIEGGRRKGWDCFVICRTGRAAESDPYVSWMTEVMAELRKNGIQCKYVELDYEDDGIKVMV